MIENINPKAFVKGIFLSLIFAIGSIVFIIQALNRKPRIIIDELGVDDMKLGIGRIDWKDIESTEFRSVFANRFIILNLSNKEKYLEKLNAKGTLVSKINKNLGSGELNLNLSLVDMNPKEIFKIVSKRIVEVKNQS